MTTGLKFRTVVNYITLGGVVQSMVFGRWSFQAEGKERVTKAALRLVLVLSASVSTIDLSKMKFRANKRPPLATSPRPIGPSASISTTQSHAMQY